MAHVVSAIIEIARHADLTLEIGTNPTEQFKVNRSTIREASPVWDRMLDPGGSFLESSKTTISLPEDDATAFAIVLRICHLDFDNLPEQDVVKIIRPFIDKWIGRSDPQSMKDYYDKYFIVALAFNFGNTPAPDWSNMVLTHVLRFSTPNSDGGYFTDGDFPTPFYNPVPDTRLKNLITTDRISLAHDIIDYDKNRLHGLWSTMMCMADTPSDCCNEALRGIVHETLSGLDIDTFATAFSEMRHHSIQDIASAYSTAAQREIRLPRGHRTCKNVLKSWDRAGMKILKRKLKRYARMRQHI